MSGGVTVIVGGGVESESEPDFVARIIPAAAPAPPIRTHFQMPDFFFVLEVDPGDV